MLPQEVATSNKHQLYKTLEHIVFPVPQQKKKAVLHFVPFVAD